MTLCLATLGLATLGQVIENVGATGLVAWGLALLGHVALWVEVVNRTHGLGWRRSVVDALTAVSGLALVGVPIAGMVALHSDPTAPPLWLITYGVVSGVVLLQTVVGRIALRWDPVRDRRSTLNQTTTLDLGENGAGSDTTRRAARLPGNQLLRVEVEERTVPLDGLPTALEGMRVAHLTDLHMSGRLSIDYFTEVVRRVNSWRPDLVCVTGDIVEYGPQLEWIDQTLGQLEPAVGSYFVLGNHDEKVDHQELRRRLASAGLTDVGGQSVSAAFNDHTFRIGGDERPWFPGDPFPGPQAGFTLCLAHSPDRFAWAVEAGVDLVLAGHVHGGQVCFPVIGPLLCPSRHGVRYAAGTFRKRGTVMHVSRGTGSLFPMRYACPPELSLITLTAGEGR